jgi:methionyl-tRNA formyltransferase
MRIALLCATRRGYLFLQKLTELLPQSDFVVFSFTEAPEEPPFLDDIRKLTLAIGGRFFKAGQVSSPHLNEFWESTPIDLMFAVSWRYMIPASIYLRPRQGTFVFHDSLLPEYRGFAPTVWSIINGEDHTGVSLFEISEHFDEGNIVDQERVPIGPDETIAVVLERTTQTYLDLLERNLDGLIKGTALRHPQDHSCASYTSKRLPEDNRIDWTAPTKTIYDLIRAVSAPYPGAYTYFSGQKMRVWSAQQVPNARRYIGKIPGRVVDVSPGEGSVVLTGDGVLLLSHVQMEDGKIVYASDILNSFSHTLGR